MNIYLNLVKTVLDKGIRRTNRTGIDTFMYFGYHYKIDLSKEILFASFFPEMS